MNKYIKTNYDVNKDTMEWALLKSSAFFKEDKRESQAENEIIDSYIICMNKMCELIKSEFIENIHVIRTYSLCIPYLYISRHIIELVLKKSIEKKTNNIRKGRNILQLWYEVKKYYNNRKLQYYDELIRTINSLDNNGQKFRYVKDDNGKEFENKPIFLNVELLKVDINNLKNELV